MEEKNKTYKETLICLHLNLSNLIGLKNNLDIYQLTTFQNNKNIQDIENLNLKKLNK